MINFLLQEFCLYSLTVKRNKLLTRYCYRYALSPLPI